MTKNQPTVMTSGARFGQLTLIKSEIREVRERRRRCWYCVCDCGNEKWIRAYALKHCVSCGCVNRARRQSGFRRTHGMRGAPEYSVWCKMISRCENPKA